MREGPGLWTMTLAEGMSSLTCKSAKENTLEWEVDAW